MAYGDNLITQAVNVLVERMAQTGTRWMTKSEISGFDFDLTGYTLKFWIGILDNREVSGFRITSHTPATGFDIAANQVYVNWTPADNVTLDLPAGSHPYVLLASNDAGVTVRMLGKGVISMPTFLTTSW